MNERPPAVWASVDGLPHVLSIRAAEHLLALSPGAFDLVWCSGWEERADEHLPHLLGVPAGRPHLRFDGRSRAQVSAHGHWKLAAIDAYAGDRPLAWLDDAFDEVCRAWAVRRGRRAPTLLVATVPAEGLTDEHAQRLSDWAAGLSTQEPGSPGTPGQNAGGAPASGRPSPG